MQLYLYKINAPHNYVNKFAKDYQLIGILDGYLKQPTSILHPSILIDPTGDANRLVADDNNNDIVDDSNNDITFISNDVSLYYANYVYIPEFKRYYYINDIIVVTNALIQINTDVDVLMSFKDDILNLDAFVARNEFNFNQFVKDDLVTYYYDKDVTEYTPEKGNLVNKTFRTNIDITMNNIAITVINDLISIIYDAVDAPDEALPKVYTTTTGDGLSSNTYATYPTMISRLVSNHLIGDESNLASGILSVVVYPFVIDTTGSDTTLRILTIDMGGEHPVTVNTLDKEMAKYLTIADFTITGNSFLDYEPFSQYELYLPYVGWIQVSADNILNKRIIVYYVVDYPTGASQVTVFDTTDNKIIYTGNCQLGVKVGMSATNQREVNDNRTSNNIALGVGLLTSAVGAIASAYTFNAVGFAASAIAAGSTIAKYVQNNNTNYLKASGNVNSGQSGLYLPQDVRIRKTVMKPKNYDSNYAHLIGKPLNAYMNLSALHGYTVVGDIHIENISSSTKTEQDDIKALLMNGVIL